VSINLVVASPTRVVVCADSRVACSDPSIPTNDNGAQKLFQAGERSVFGYAGIGVFNGLNHGGDQRDNPRKLLEDFRDAYRSPLFAALASQTDLLKRILPGTPVVFSAFCLTRKPSGEIELAELVFPLRDRGDGTPELAEPAITGRTITPKPKSSFLSPHGFVYCNPPDPAVDPFTVTILKLASEINPDDPDAEILREVDHAFGTAIERDPACARSIGGTIIVAAIDADGFRWLRSASV